MGDWVNDMKTTEDAQPWNVEYGSGYCTVVMAHDRPEAKRKAGRSRVPGDWQARVALATEDEIEWFKDSGGIIR